VKVVKKPRIGVEGRKGDLLHGMVQVLNAGSMEERTACRNTAGNSLSRPMDRPHLNAQRTYIVERGKAVKGAEVQAPVVRNYLYTIILLSGI
jgi:hypothetical protein